MTAEVVHKDFAPQQARFTWEHLSFIVILMTLFISLSAFWQFQVRLWNRVPYNVGPWEYKIPFYDISDNPTQAYLETMINKALLFSITSIVFNIFILIFVLSVKNKNESNKSIWTMYILSGIMTFITYWNYRSITLAPKDWFRSELGNFDAAKWQFGGFDLPGKETRTLRYFFIVNTFGAALVVSLIIFVIIGAILFMGWFKENKRGFYQGVIGFIAIFISILIVASYINIYLTLLVVSSTISLLWILLSDNRAIATKTVVFYYVMFGFFLYTVVPVLYTLVISMSSIGDLNKNRIVPSNPADNLIINYSSVVFILNTTGPSFSKSFMISIGLGFGTAIGGLIITLPAAYAISRFRFRGNNSAQFLVIATQMFPGIILLLPQFFFWKQLGFLDAEKPDRLILGVLLAYFVGALAYNVWMMKGYFDTLPRDLEEAALIDGESSFGSFIKVAIPLAAPGMVAVSIFTFLGAWNEFALAQIFIGEGKEQAPLPLLFFQYQDTAAPDNPPFFQLLSAYSILAALPIVILFLSLQKYLTSGLTSGGVK